ATFGYGRELLERGQDIRCPRFLLDVQPNVEDAASDGVVCKQEVFDAPDERDVTPPSIRLSRMLEYLRREIEAAVRKVVPPGLEIGGEGPIAAAEVVQREALRRVGDNAEQL